MRSFLAAPPARSVLMGDERGLEALPVRRRTLEMAREWVEREVGVLEGRRGEVAGEAEAVGEGSVVWNSVVGVVGGFEDRLRRVMKGEGVGDVGVLEGQIGDMKEVIGELEGSYNIAVEKGWNLLVCAVGAELEAFKEGEAMLRGALEAVKSEESLLQEESKPQSGSKSQSQSQAQAQSQ